MVTAAARGASDALVFFGATGDLAYKQIFPALAGLISQGRLDMPVIGVAKAGWDRDRLAQRARASLAEQGVTDQGTVRRLVELLHYVDGDYRDPATFQALRTQLGSTQAPLFYLAIPPALFGTVVTALGESGCAANARVVVEKPFGRDLADAQKLNELLHRWFPEESIFRVDHFLGKEAVLGLLYFRFANTFPESFWNRFYIDSVQVTMAEDFGVADRGAFYDATGVIRDVVQNHLLQVVSLLAMEPPSGYGHQDIREEKAKVLRAMPPLRRNNVVRGQFAGYTDVDGVAPASTVETFVALRAHVDTWRWAGVPFFIRAGKQLPVTATEALIRLRRPPSALAADDADHPPNYVRFRLSPDGAISVGVTVRAPGDAMAGEDVELAVLRRPGEADVPPYQRLLGDAMMGDASLFTTEHGVEAAWTVVGPVLDESTAPLPYEPGTWGPEQAGKLTAAHGGWHDPASTATR